MTEPASVLTERVKYSPSVAALLAQNSAEAKLGRLFVRFAEALMHKDSSRIDAVVTPDARFHELEEAGFAPGPHGFKVFRKQINDAFPDEHVEIVEMRFPEPGIIETELDCKATHRGELMGNPPTGKEVSFKVHTRNRFEGDRMAERWDRMDVGGLLAQLKA